MKYIKKMNIKILDMEIFQIKIVSLKNVQRMKSIMQYLVMIIIN